MRTMRRNHIFIGVWLLALGIGMASCLSGGQLLPDNRVQHNMSDADLTAQRASASAPHPMASAMGTAAEIPSAAPSAPPRVRLISDRYEEVTGIKLSPLDKAIMNECPTRQWSTNVPKRRCVKDDECGDGFCDRGRCAAIRTCASDYGQRCQPDDECGWHPCRDGRCRSCVSTAECASMRNEFGTDPECLPDPDIPGARFCIGEPASLEGQEYTPPPSKPPP